MRSNHTCIRLLLVVGAVSWPMAVRAQAEMNVNRSQAEADFSVLLLLPCLTHVERSVPIAALPDDYKQAIIPAPQSISRFSAFKGVNAVWASKLMGPHVLIAEIGADKCVIVADQLPVEETLQHAADATTKLQPPFNSMSVKIWLLALYLPN